MEILGVER